jgi:hypothetical protein
MTALCAEGARWLRQNNKPHYVFVMKDQSIKDLSDEQISEMLAYLVDEMQGKHDKSAD